MIRLFQQHARSMRLLLTVLFVATAVLGEPGAKALAQSNPTTTQVGTPLPPAGPVIVALRNDAITAASDFVAAADIEPTQVYTSAINGFAATLSSATIRNLASNPLVANIIADTPVSHFAQYTPTQIKRTGFAKYPTAAIDGVDQVVDIDVAFLDGGIDRNHPDLNVAGGYSCVAGADPYYDPSSHGTHTAGIAAARDNDLGIVGAAPGARIWSIKVFDDSGVSSQSAVLCGLDWIVGSGSGIDVVNLSIGNNSGSTSISTCFSQVDPLHDAICSINSAGITIVVAAGNMSTNANTYNYAKFPETISVAAIADFNGWPGGGATDSCGYNDGSDDTFTNFSNYGTVVDIAAPGSCVFSTVPGGYEFGKGTSMAAPLVAGAVALYLAQQPGASPLQVRTWLLGDAASKQRTSSVGYTGGSTGTNRILYLGSIPPSTYPAGSSNPTFSGTKLAIIGSLDAPVTDRTPLAYDGNAATKWYSPPTSPISAQIRFDLGSGFRISGVKWKFDYIGYADEFSVRLFDNNGISRTFGPFGNATQANAFFGQNVSDNQAYRYVEFFFENPRNLPSIGSVSEIEIWGVPFVTNSPGILNPTFPGASQPITNSSDTPATQTSNRAFDGVSYSNWASGANSPGYAKVMFDLGSDRNLSGVKWKMAHLGYADEFIVRVYASNDAWRDLGKFGNPGATQTWYGVATTSLVSARFVELIFLNPNADVALGSLAEIEIWTSDVTNLPGTANPTFAGVRAPVTNSFDTPSSGTTGRARDGVTWSNWSVGNTPTTARITFDLGSDKSISGVKWQMAYSGAADQFTVRVIGNNPASSFALGTFGNPGSTGTWYGSAIAGSVTGRFIEFTFDNPNLDPALGSLAEVEIWVNEVTSSPGTQNPSLNGTKATIQSSWDTPFTGTSNRALDGVSWSNWSTSSDSPSYAKIMFDLGVNHDLGGIQWQMAYLGYADQFIIRVYSDAGEWRDLGTFGNPGLAQTWFGFPVNEIVAARYVEFIFLNPNRDPALGSIAEVEIYGTDSIPIAAAALDPALAGAPLPITCTADPTSDSVPLACDQNGGTNWHTDPTTPETVTLTVTLQEAATLTGIKWNFAQQGNAERFTVSIGLGDVVTSLGEFSGGAANTYEGIAFDEEVIADRVILTFTNVDADTELGYLAEVEVWSEQLPVATPGASPEASPSPDAGTPEPVETATPTEVPASPDASPAPEETVEPTATTEPASPEPATEITEPTATEQPASPEATVEPTETLEPTATETTELTATVTTEPTAEPTAAVSLGTISGTDDDAVNCRITAPDGEPITQLNEGDEIEVTGAAIEGWYPVICAGEAGFIAEQFVTIGTPTEVSETTPTATVEGEVSPTLEATAEPTEEEVAEETPYPVADTGDTENSGTAWLANDNDPDTWWSLYPSQSPEQARLYLDLGAVLPIDRLTLELATWDQLPTFEIWLSEDGETWYNATPGGINGWNLDRETPITITLGYDARYIRIVIPNVDESGLGEVGGISQINVWAGDINQTQYLTSLGEATTPTLPPVEPTEEVIKEPTEEIVEPTEVVVEEPTEEVIPTEVVPTEVVPTEEVPTGGTRRVIAVLTRVASGSDGGSRSPYAWVRRV